jgi:hypothetical protein
LTADEYLGAISTRLGNVHVSIKSSLRNFEFKTSRRTAQRIERVKPLMRKAQDMSKVDNKEFDLARKNADSAKIKEITDREGITEEYQEVRNVLDELYREWESVGGETGYLNEFNPRSLKDPKGYLKFMRGLDDWPLIQKALDVEAAQLGKKYLEPEEQAAIINSLLRGFKKGKITLSKPGELKAREIDHIDVTLDKFYMDSDAALTSYIAKVTEAIEARRLFGKTAKRLKKGELEKVWDGKSQPEETIDESIGDYVGRLLNEGKIDASDEYVIKDILSARFNQSGTRGIVSLYKNASYIDTMGSFTSAVTQIGDTAWALYRNGVPETRKAFVAAVKKQSKVPLSELGIDKPSIEFTDQTKAAELVGRVFDMTGLSRMDVIGKETLINAEYSTITKRAIDPIQRVSLEKELRPVFEGETQALIEDLQAGRITDNVRLHLWNTLSDFQPIALSEMPQKYLTAGNGRIFYMLKSFTLKQFDVYRREVFQQIAKPETRVKGIKNLVKLSTAFVAANASADVIKNVLLGRPINPDDLVVDNMLRLFGISKFVTWKAREEGVGSAAARQILPPVKLIDALTKDINNAWDGKGLETVGSIPIVGKLYYWWLGRGRDKIERRKSSKIAN